MSLYSKSHRAPCSYWCKIRVKYFLFILYLLGYRMLLRINSITFLLLLRWICFIKDLLVVSLIVFCWFFAHWNNQQVKQVKINWHTPFSPPFTLAVSEFVTYHYLVQVECDLSLAYQVSLKRSTSTLTYSAMPWGLVQYVIFSIFYDSVLHSCNELSGWSRLASNPYEWVVPLRLYGQCYMERWTDITDWVDISIL